MRFDCTDGFRLNIYNRDVPLPFLDGAYVDISTIENYYFKEPYLGNIANVFNNVYVNRVKWNNGMYTKIHYRFDKLNIRKEV